MAEETHTETRGAKQAWLNALLAAGDDPTRQPLIESPISVDISACGTGAKEFQEAICGGAKLLRAKVMDIRAVALPKDDQRRVEYLQRQSRLIRNNSPTT